MRVRFCLFPSSCPCSCSCPFPVSSFCLSCRSLTPVRSQVHRAGVNTTSSRRRRTLGYGFQSVNVEIDMGKMPAQGKTVGGKLQSAGS